MPTGLTNFGERLGTAAMGGSAGSMAQDITKALLIQGFTQNNQMKMEAVKNGLGITYDREKKQLTADPNIYTSDIELGIGRSAYEKRVKDATRKEVTVGIDLLKQQTTLVDLFQKFQKKGENPQVLIGLANQLNDLLGREQINGVENPFQRWQKLDLEKLQADSAEYKNNLMANIILSNEGANQGNMSDYISLQILSGTHPELVKSMGIDLGKTLAAHISNLPLNRAQQVEDVSKARQIARDQAGIQEGKERRMVDYREKAATGRPGQEVRDFEIVTGMDPSKRGTEEYKKAYLDWNKQQVLARPYYPVVQTGTGFYQVNTREPGAPAMPVTAPGGGDQLGGRMPATVTTELADMKRTYEQLTDVRSKADSMKDKFGPISGRWAKVKAKFVDEGPTQEVLNEVKSLITIAYALSGKQISVQEIQMLEAAILPRLEQPYENFLASLGFAQDWVGRTHNERLDYYKASGYATGINPLPTKPIQGKGQPKSTKKFEILEVK